MSIFEINNSKNPLINCSATCANNTINKWINHGVDGPLIDSRKAVTEDCEKDHSYLASNEHEVGDIPEDVETMVL